jgi:hypothetical protein
VKRVKEPNLGGIPRRGAKALPALKRSDTQACFTKVAKNPIELQMTIGAAVSARFVPAFIRLLA